jgi:prepilin-type N-terminal cleavage/methylation domain-containing protein
VTKERRCNTGFSLVEMLLAIAMVSILGAVALPSLAKDAAPFRAQAAGREVYAALQEGRQQAITRSTSTRFRVVDDSSYLLEWNDAGTWRTIRGPMPLDPNVRLVSSAGDLTFGPRGTLAPASMLTVSDVQHPEHSLVLDIVATGLIRIQKGGG